MDTNNDQEHWNVHDRPIRTNNNIEGHNRLNKLVGRSHANIYKLLKCLIEDSSMDIIEIGQLVQAKLFQEKLKNISL
jgi:hypothetical protein